MLTEIATILKYFIQNKYIYKTVKNNSNKMDQEILKNNRYNSKPFNAVTIGNHTQTYTHNLIANKLSFWYFIKA